MVESLMLMRLGRDRRGSHNFTGRRLQRDRHPELHGLAEDGIANLLAHADGGGLGIRDELLARHDRRAWHVSLAQNLDPFIARLGADHWLEDVLQRLPMFSGNSPRRIFEARIGNQLRQVEGEDKLAPERRVTTGGEQVLMIGCLEQPVAWDRTQRILRPVIKRRHLLMLEDAARLER